MKRGAFLSVLLLSVIVVSSCTLESGNEDSGGEVFIALDKGEMAKDFTLPDLDGEKVTLSDLRGKVVLLNFWATWCPPCRKEMPSMESLHRKYGEKDLVILAVAIDRKGAKVAKPFVEENGLTFPVLIDRRGRVSDLYGVYAVPTTFVIDRNGTIVDKVQGAADWFSEEAQNFFEELIGKTEKG